MAILKKSLRSHYPLVCCAAVFICFALGYILLVGIDKIVHPTAEEFYFSTYTVFTQFGPIIFSVIVLYFYISDYNGKNILFYKLLGYKALRYYLEKQGILVLWLLVPTIIMSLLISLVYNDYSKLVPMFLCYAFVLVYIVLIASIWGFLFKNLILSFCVNLSLWLISIVASSYATVIGILAYFDASNSFYENVENYLSGSLFSSDMIINPLLYDVGLFVVVAVVVFLFRRRWQKNGI
jgi:putative peptide transport system permease protein